MEAAVFHPLNSFWLWIMDLACSSKSERWMGSDLLVLPGVKYQASSHFSRWPCFGLVHISLRKRVALELCYPWVHVVCWFTVVRGCGRGVMVKELFMCYLFNVATCFDLDCV